jgi:hypothetical protein
VDVLKRLELAEASGLKSGEKKTDDDSSEGEVRTAKIVIWSGKIE